MKEETSQGFEKELEMHKQPEPEAQITELWKSKSACGLSKVVTILLIVVKYDRFEKSQSAAMMTVVHDSKRRAPWYCGANHFLLMLLPPFQQQWSVVSHLQISSTFPATVLREN